MSELNHQNVTKLIGISFESDGSPIILMPFMRNGDLLTYIRDGNNKPTVKQLILFAIDIAKGMEYLSSQTYVHRDLAARNCMLGADNVVKVSDFGLARDIHEKGYYRPNSPSKLPYRWMAYECFIDTIFNEKTDVWSYGVVIWELMTRGLTPYDEYNTWDEILSLLKNQHRLAQPRYCPDQLYTLMIDTWNLDSNIRPNFTEILDIIDKIISKLEMNFRERKYKLIEFQKTHKYINVIDPE